MINYQPRNNNFYLTFQANWVIYERWKLYRAMKWSVHVHEAGGGIIMNLVRRALSCVHKETHDVGTQTGVLSIIL